MKRYFFNVPIDGFVIMEVVAESEIEARKKIKEQHKDVYEDLPEIETWYTNKAQLRGIKDID